MRHRGAVRGWKRLSRFALIGVIGSGAAACSTDASRLSEPFSNPFSSITGEPSATGSLGAGEEGAQTTAPAIRTPRVQSQELAAPGATMSPRQAKSSATFTPVGANVSGMNPSGLNPDSGKPAKPQAMTPRVVPSAPQPKLQFGQGPKPAEKKAAEAAEAKKLAEAKKAADAKKASEAKKVAEAKPKADPKKAEAAKKADAEAKAARAEAAKDAAKKVADAKAAEAAAKASSKETKVAAKEVPASAPAKPAPAAEPANTGSVAADSSESFRWPAKGRVINGYGSSGNEGINIAVPEGTPVKAAEDGTVAYAGSDVKGYGKLVLVRHSNGFVSAYAHNGELDVRPGEKVKRGQTIAKSGATGNVTSPQLHFEIRKGATPVDPIPHLASN